MQPQTDDESFITVTSRERHGVLYYRQLNCLFTAYSSEHKNGSSVSLNIVRKIHIDSTHKWPVMAETFSWHDTCINDHEMANKGNFFEIWILIFDFKKVSYVESRFDGCNR